MKLVSEEIIAITMNIFLYVEVLKNSSNITADVVVVCLVLINN